MLLGLESRHLCPRTPIRNKHDIEHECGISGNRPAADGTISELVGDVNLPLIADVHILKSCRPAVYQIGNGKL